MPKERHSIICYVEIHLYAMVLWVHNQKATVFTPCCLFTELCPDPQITHSIPIVDIDALSDYLNEYI